MYKKNVDRHTAGSTMIEVLVAVLVVMLMVGMFSRVVTVSVSMLSRTKKMIVRTEEFNKAYYRTDAVKTKTGGQFRLKFRNDSMELTTDMARYDNGSLSMYSFSDGEDAGNGGGSVTPPEAPPSETPPSETPPSETPPSEDTTEGSAENTPQYFYVAGEKQYKVEVDYPDMKALQSENINGVNIPYKSVIFWNGEYYWLKIGNYLSGNGDIQAFMNANAIKINTTEIITPVTGIPEGSLRLNEDGQIQIFAPYDNGDYAYTNSGYWHTLATIDDTQK